MCYHPYQGKKLQGRANRFSVRLGRDYRLVYSVYSSRGASATPSYLLSAATTASISLSVL